MIKKLLSVATALTLLVNASAQNHETPEQELKRSVHHNYIQQALREQAMAGAAQKPTGSRQRVIAQSTTSGSSIDSTSYAYTGTRGSRFNHNAVSYNSIMLPLYAPHFLHPSFDKGMDVLADTMADYHNGFLRYKDYGTYRPDDKLNLIITEFDTTYTYDRSWTQIIYNADGNIDREYYDLYDLPSLHDTTYLTAYTYQNGKVLTDSFWVKENGSWSLVNIKTHSYNSQGKLITDSLFSVTVSGPELVVHTALTYYPDNRLRTLTTTQFTADSTYVSGFDSLGYTNNLDYPTFREYRSPVSIFGIRTIREMVYPGASGLPDSMRHTRIYNGDTTISSYMYQYNSFDNPERISRFVNNSSGTPASVSRFYYEIYDNGLAVADRREEEGPEVFPNPFREHINIVFKGNSNGNYAFRLLNINGKEFYRARVKVTGNAARITVPGLSDGVYLLLLSDGKNRTYSKQLIRH